MLRYTTRIVQYSVLPLIRQRPFARSLSVNAYFKNGLIRQEQVTRFTSHNYLKCNDVFWGNSRRKLNLSMLAFGLLVASCDSNKDDRKNLGNFIYRFLRDPFFHSVIYFFLLLFLTDKQLFKAARFGDLVGVERLLKNGADPNQRHPLGWTLLQVAAIQGHVQIVKALLKYGADPNLGDDFSNVFLMAREKHIHSLDGILKEGAPLDKLLTFV